MKNNLSKRVVKIVKHTKREFFAHMDEDTYVEISYCGAKQKSVDNYKIQIWMNECGCIYDEMKLFSSIDDAISFSIFITE